MLKNGKKTPNPPRQKNQTNEMDFVVRSKPRVVLLGGCRVDAIEDHVDELRVEPRRFADSDVNLGTTASATDG
jgi:hypothetical protein